jgi:succinate dehydrogenase / fumarate reductase, iron-sulfur subunit
MANKDKGLTLNLKIWRQPNPKAPGQIKDYKVEGISTDCSFLEMLDILNEDIIRKGEEQPVAFDYDCREGICGSCGLVINGVPHGPQAGTTTCQVHMRLFKSGDTIYIEPWRANAFPVVKDLVVDRSAFDKIIESGGYIGTDAGSAMDANEVLIPKPQADKAFDYAACIGCGACVAACKNASAMLFVGAKVSQFVELPQGHAERDRRAVQMVTTMETLGFGACSNEGECEAVCPKEIKTEAITTLIKEYNRALLRSL